MAAGLGADVVITDINPSRLERLSVELPRNVRTLFGDSYAIADELRRAALVIGAVLLPGRKAPHLITREHLKLMKPGSVIVDVCIDQGGCAETSRPTSHEHPTFVEDGIVHYCVTNMPGAVPQTSTRALTAATLPYVRELARLGVDGFLAQSVGHLAALNMRGGKIMSADVASAFPDLPLATAA
jgi:alanine dehydrogenase